VIAVKGAPQGGGVGRLELVPDWRRTLGTIDYLVMEQVSLHPHVTLHLAAGPQVH
jgi:hypothetical protein